MGTLEVAPVLSTPSELLLEQNAAVPLAGRSGLSQEQLELRYEIGRTIEEIRMRKWRRVGLQFPDDMLVDAPRVLALLRDGLRTTLNERHSPSRPNVEADAPADVNTTDGDSTEELPRLTILGDTSYGACCVDEIAAEHVAADGVVHYGRSCLSPTQRLDVVYVFTTRSLDHTATTPSVMATIPDRAASICLLADVPWQEHMTALQQQLHEAGYTNVIAPPLTHNPTSLIPNRLLPSVLQQEPGALQKITVFHVGTPPTALLLTLTSRVHAIHIYDPDSGTASEASASMLLRRRYASLLKVSSAAIIGILINTLSVKNYMSALDHVQTMITAAKKKSYTFVVGKVNTAKLANFAEVGGWVVIGCWESSLIDSKDFLVPVITPFELELALMKDEERVWGHEWIGDFQTLLQRSEAQVASSVATGDVSTPQDDSDDEPPDFDLRTGRYVSHTRMKTASSDPSMIESSGRGTSSALVQRAKGDLTRINGVSSPGAEYLRSKRDWQGLGSDFEVAYDRDEQGNIQGATMEQGRAGVAKGYSDHSNATGR